MPETRAIRGSGKPGDRRFWIFVSGPEPTKDDSTFFLYNTGPTPTFLLFLPSPIHNAYYYNNLLSSHIRDVLLNSSFPLRTSNGTNTASRSSQRIYNALPLQTLSIRRPHRVTGSTPITSNMLLFHAPPTAVLRDHPILPLSANPPPGLLVSNLIND